MIFPILYKYTSKGQVQQWQIFVDGDSYYTEEGILNGKITRSLPTQCVPKNVGKKSETNGEAQALAEAKAKHQKKLDTHYNEVLTEERSFYEPMLAESLDDYRKYLYTVRTFIQPKYDGVRAISQNGQLTSRGGKFWVSCPHLQQSSVVLDGELYTHELKDDFDSLTSLFRKQKPTVEDIALCAEKGEMWVYDFPEHKGVFSARYEELTKWYLEENTNDKIMLVPTVEIFNDEQLEFWHNEFLEQGYEGSIVRLDLDNYENKRTKQVLKYKVWIDDEFEVVGFTEAKGTKKGMVGKVLLKTKEGLISGANYKGSHAASKKVWENRDFYIGLMATTTFQNYTPKGNIRIGYVKEFNRAEYETV